MNSKIVSAKSLPVRNELIFALVKSFDANISHFWQLCINCEKLEWPGNLLSPNGNYSNNKTILFCSETKSFSIIVVFCLIIKISF